MAKRILAHTDNAEAQLNAGINASTLTIPLKAGDGAALPQPINGSATSGGTTVALNSTGIQAAGVVAGDIIENVTDGSYAVVLSVATNAIVTTPLRGGSDNTWQNSDVWAVRRFVLTLVQYDTDGTTVLKREQVLIKARSTDTLTAETGGRGYNGSTAYSFLADDYAYVLWTSASDGGLQQVITDIIQDVAVAIKQTNAEAWAVDAVGTDAYAITLVPPPTAYTTGMVVWMKAGTANTGPATIDVNGLGVKDIKKQYNTALETGDILANQVVGLVYDGTNFQMLSMGAQSVPSKADIQNAAVIYAEDAVGTDAYAITLTPAPSAYVTGQIFAFKVGTANTGPATLNVNGLGAKDIRKNYNVALSTGDLLAGQRVMVIYDGTLFQLLSPTVTAPNERVVTTTDDATSVIDVGATDTYQLTAIANNTEFTTTGTPVDGQKLTIRLKDAGVSKTLTWTFATALGVTLPTSTTAGKWHYIGLIYNAAASQWHAVAVQTQA